MVHFFIADVHANCKRFVSPNDTFGHEVASDLPPGSVDQCKSFIVAPRSDSYQIRLQYLDLPNQSCEDGSFTIHTDFTDHSPVWRTFCGPQRVCEDIIVPISREMSTFVVYYTVTVRKDIPYPKGFVAELEKVSV